MRSAPRSSRMPPGAPGRGDVRRSPADRANGLLLVTVRGLNSYWPAAHPFTDSDSPQYTFDPQAAQELLQSAGWLDPDGDTATPRACVRGGGRPGWHARSSSIIWFLRMAERQAAAEIVEERIRWPSVASGQMFKIEEACSVTWPPGQRGRCLDGVRHGPVGVAANAVESPCAFFSSSEVPGPFPAFVKGWGGFNAAGYGPAHHSIRPAKRARFSACRAIPNALSGQAERGDDIRRRPTGVAAVYSFQNIRKRPQVCPPGFGARFRQCFLESGKLRGWL